MLSEPLQSGNEAFHVGAVGDDESAHSSRRRSSLSCHPTDTPGEKFSNESVRGIHPDGCDLGLILSRLKLASGECCIGKLTYVEAR